MSYAQDLVNGYAAAHQRLMGPTPKTKKYIPQPEPDLEPPVQLPPRRTFVPPPKFDLSTLNSVTQKLSLTALFRWVCHHEHVTETEMRARYRDRRICDARHIFGYLARQYGEASFPRIGRILDRDHTTVMYGWTKLRKLRRVNPFVADALGYYEEIIESLGYPQNPHTVLIRPE